MTPWGYLVGGLRELASRRAARPVLDYAEAPAWVTNPAIGIPTYRVGRAIDHGVDVEDQAALYARHHWTFACVRKIAVMAADVRVRWYVTRGAKNIEIEPGAFPTPTIADLFRWINPRSSEIAFWRGVHGFLALTGNSYLFPTRLPAPHNRDAVYTLFPQCVKALGDPVEQVKGYEYKLPGASAGVYLPSSRVIAINEWNPDATTGLYYGTSPLHSLRKEIDSDLLAGEWNRLFFKNSATPEVVLESDQPMPADATRERMRDEWNKRHQGYNKAHKAAFLWGGLKAHVVTPNQRDMQFLQGRDAIRKEIFSAFGMNDSIMGLDTTNLAQTKELVRTAYFSTILPQVAFVLEQISQHPLIPEPIRAEADPSNVWALADTWLDKSAAATQLVLAGIADENEARELVGLKERPKGYKPPTQPEPPMRAALRSATVTGRMDRDTGDLIWRAFVNRTERREIKFVRALAPVFSDQRDAILDRIKDLTRTNGATTTRASVADLLAEVARHNDALVAAWLRQANEAMLAEASLAISQVGGSGVFAVKDPRVIEWLQKRGKKFAAEVQDTTYQTLKDSLSEGLAAGEDLIAIRERVNSVFENVADVERAKTGRGMTIARTEVNAASNRGIVEGWRQSGEVSMKEWLDSRDSDVRDSHRNVAPVQLDAEFRLSSGATGPCPGEMGDAAEDCNCRCTMVPVLRGGEE